MDDYSKKVKRNILFRRVIEDAIMKGIIAEPATFKNGIDYKKEINFTNPNNAEYFMKRGFIKIFKQDYTSDNPPTGIWEYTTQGIENPSVYPYRDFVSYIRAAMWYTPEEFEAQYPSALYPLIKQRYDLVVNHLKSTYGIDLQAIARGPQE